MKFLPDLWRVVRVSRVLDDRSDRSNRAEAELDDQGRVDAELADARRIPWRSPSRNVRSRVLIEIESRRFRKARRRTLPDWPLRIAAVAAVALLVWGLPVWRTPNQAPAFEAFQPIAVARAEAAERGLDERLRDEAVAIGEDTRRAAELLLERLPFGGD